MSDLGLKFLSAALGHEGAKALMKATAREPALADVLIPRAILGWLDFTTEHEYEGPIPGCLNSYVQFQKSEAGISGVISLQEGTYSFEKSSVYHLAASIAMALGIQPSSLDADVRDQILVKLGKSIDTLAKAQVLVHELKSPKALKPTRMTTHGAYHIEHIGHSNLPYTVVHTASNKPVQTGIAHLRDAQPIAEYHQNRYGGHFKHELSKKTLDPSHGITFTHEHHDLGDGDMITHVKAHHPSGQVVGEVAMEYNHGSPTMKPDVTVHPDFRRLGIASAMYGHAQKITGKAVAPSSAQSPMAQALWAGNAKAPQFGKVELPGQTHQPTAQHGPQTPAPPMKQPTQAAKPKQKLPSLSLGKSEAERECQMCGGRQFVDNKFKGCICWSDISGLVKTTAYGDGFVLDFKPGADLDTVKALIKALRSKNE